MIKKIFENKKAMGIRDLYPIVITITVIGILLAVMLMIFSNWIDITNDNEGAIYNETSSAVSLGAYDTVANATTCGFKSFVITIVTNVTTPETVNLDNYTVVSTTDGTWGLTTAGDNVGEYNNSALNVSYTFEYGGEDCEVMESITTDFVDFIPWIGIILLVVAAAIVLGIVISSFAGKKRI